MHRLWVKIVFVTVIILASLLTFLHVFLVFHGRNLIINQLESMTKKKVTIADFAITAPFDLQVRKLNIQGLAQVDSIYISPSIPYLLFGQIALNQVKITRPDLTFERPASPAAKAINSSGSVVIAPLANAVTQPVPDTDKAAIVRAKVINNKLPRLILKHVSIEDGRINFLDHAAGKDGIKIIAKDINFDLTNLYLVPHPAITNFELKGKLPWKEGEAQGTVEASGWLNLFKKDMQAQVQVRDIDGIYLYPYYSEWVDLEKAHIQQAKLNFNSNINGLNNNVTADCHLELTDIVRTPRSIEENPEKAEKIADAVLDIFKNMNQGKIVLDFTIHTKMTRPEFGFTNIKMAFEDQLAKGRGGISATTKEVLSLPATLMRGAIKGFTDLTSAMLGGTISAGKQIGRVIRDSIKK